MAGSLLQMNVTVGGNAALCAGFVRPQVAVTLQDAEGGTLEPAAATYTFDAGDPMRIAAVPDGDHAFNYWDSPLDAWADPYKAETVIRPKEALTVVPLYYSRPGLGAIDTVAK